MTSKSFPLAASAVLALLALLALDPQGARAEGKFWKDSPPRYDVQQPEETAAKLLSENPQLYGAGSLEELQWLETPRIESIAYVRFQQVHQSVIVEGAQLVVTVDGEGRIFQLSDSTVSPLFLQDPALCVSEEEARERVLQEKPDALVQGARGPLYVAGDSSSAWLVRVVRVKTDGQPFGLWEVYIDCGSGEPVGFRDLLVRAEGNVYDPNPVVNPTVQRVTLPNLTSATNLEGSLAVAFACTDTYCDNMTQRAVADMDGNFLYDPVEPSTTDPFSEVTGYYHVDKISTWFETQLSYFRNCGVGGRQVAIAVNMDYPNAFAGDINGDDCMDIVIGQDMAAGGHDFAYDADVIYHEFTHGVNHETAGFRGMGVDELGYDFSSGALDEGTADYFSVAQTDDPVLGDYALAGSIRHADNSRTCPQSLQGESHEDGQIWTGTFWEIRDAIGDHEADLLMLAVLRSLTSRADFNEGGQAIKTQAGLLETAGTIPAGGAAAVEDIVDGRGLPGCERIVTLHDGDTASAWLMGVEEWGGWVDQIPGGIQFALPTPPEATRAVLRFSVIGYGTIDYDVYVNYNAPVGFVREEYRPVPTTYQYAVNDAPDGLAWTDFSDPAFIPGTTYYIALVSRCAYTAYMTITASVIVPSPVEETDAEETHVEDAEEVAPETVDAVETAESPADPTFDDAIPEMPHDDADAGDGADVSGLITSEGGCGCRTVQ